MADDPTRRVANAFDVLAPSYEVLQFVRQAAERLVEVADLRPGARVLDVATGTGHAARAAAERVGPSGSVLGIDISDGMLEIARGTLAPLGLPIEMRVGDVQALDLPDASFDAVICASGIFFVPDMDAAARECRRVLVSGGQLAFTSFGASMLEDLRVRFGAVLARHGFPPKPPPAMPLQEPAENRDLLLRAGFVDVETWTEQLGYHLPDGEARWREIEASLEGRALNGVPPEVVAAVRAEHVAELDGLAGQDGIWVDVATNFATGRAP
jgi:ubiquinone/menaquinone biosynthesis C-methylase UbiE